MSDAEVGVVHMLKRANPTLMATEIINALAHTFGRVFSEVDISHAIIEGLEPLQHHVAAEVREPCGRTLPHHARDVAAARPPAC